MGYSMPNPFYTYILNIYDFLTHSIDNIFKQVRAHVFLTSKWFQVFLCVTNNSIKNQSFVYIQYFEQFNLA